MGGKVRSRTVKVKDVLFYSDAQGEAETLLRVANTVLLRSSNHAVENTRWKFHSTPEKVRAFMAWLKSQLASQVAGKSEEDLWRRYIEEGFRKGAGRAFDDSRVAERTAAHMGGQERLDFYRGTREQFLRSSFGRPESLEKVQLLAGRTFTDLQGVTDAMSVRMSRILTDGLVEGKHPLAIARDLNDDLDIGRGRAELIARTELIRAHAEGQLAAFEEMGVEEIGVAVEWSTAGDDAVCDECSPLEGVVLRVDEAHNLLPRHVNCRCSFIPANVGEDKEGQKRSKTDIGKAFSRSVREEGGKAKSDWMGADRTVSRDRPRSVLGNAFCPTGPGGGIDPSCSPDTGKSMTDVKVGERVKFLSHVGEVVDFGKYEDVKAKYPEATIVAGRDVPESKFKGGRTWAVKFEDGVRLFGSVGMRLMLKRGTP